MSTGHPNILFLMTDQQRFDTIAALGNPHIYTPNYDRLVRRGVSFTRAYSTCPVCVPARYTIRTGCEPKTTRVFSNRMSPPAPGQGETMTARCGPYLAQTMRGLGYRTFGIGKFHTSPWDEALGYDVHLHSEEIYRNADQRSRDAYAAWIAREHPEFDFIEALMGERTEMYYMPQMSPIPAEFGVERWAADRAIEQVAREEDKPWFGLVSFIGPHPPFAPPLPYNRMYDPDLMPNPVRGDFGTDLMDEQIANMNYAIWADDISDSRARSLKARYYGEISYIDDCIGRILDAVEEKGDVENTLICFFSDHGDHMGDHHAWQKESFFEASCHVPFLLSWPAQLPADTRNDALVCLTDLFGLATRAAGRTETREGIDMLGMLAGEAPRREELVGIYGHPGTPLFKAMVRADRWKYIFMANGGREQLFNLETDPDELRNVVDAEPHVVCNLRAAACAACNHPGTRETLAGNDLISFPFNERPLKRVCQFDRSRGIRGFPERPEDMVR